MADCAALNAAWASTQWGSVMPDDGGGSEGRLAAEQAIQCNLLRDIFSPFCETNLLPAVLARNGYAVRNIARHIYEEREYSFLPVLADALEDAGCSDSELLGHCRAGGEHVRGCWVIDSVLSKS